MATTVNVGPMLVSFDATFRGRTDMRVVVEDQYGATVAGVTLTQGAERDQTASSADWFPQLAGVPSTYLPGTAIFDFVGRNATTDPGFRPVVIDLAGYFGAALELGRTVAPLTGPYAAVSDVQALFPTQILTIGATSAVTSVTVSAWLQDASNWIDATLRWRYMTPITDANDIAILGPICAMLVAARVWNVLSGYSKDVPGNGAAFRAAALADLAYDPKSGRSNLALPSMLLAGDETVEIAIPSTSFTDPSQTSNPDIVQRLFTMAQDL